MALQHQSEEVALLLGRALQADVFKQAVMVLRDLPQRGVGGGDDGDHLGQCGERHLRTAMCPWHGNAPQPTVGECVDDVCRHFPASIALCGAVTQQGGDLVGDADRFGIVADDMGCRTADFVGSREDFARHGQLDV